jgi:Domain of unknown function (DUF4476)
MKKLLLTAALLAAFAHVQAEHELSDLHLRLFDHTAFTVVLDGNQFNTTTDQFRLSGVEPGIHYLTVMRRPYRTHNTPWHHGQVIFSGNIEIPASAKVKAIIDRTYRFRIYKVIPIIPEPVCGTPPPVCPPVPPVCAPVHYGMHPDDFNMLKYTIENRNFDSSRLQIAKQAIDVNELTTAQVKELMRLLTFDSYKLDLAKYAYHKVVDKNNYWMVNDEFTFESSIRDLNYFLGHG